MARQSKKGVTQSDTAAAASETSATKTAKPKAPARASTKAAPAEKKPAARKAAPRKATPRQATNGTGARSSRKAAPATGSEVSPEQRYRMIQDAAYFIAERNGFTGDNHAHWLEAEKAIDAQLASR
ncbi:DUF2934 domain-containing protein [Thioalkalivibrio paradoxus]|uniref:DUF2934 domain-containing protein n=1 Tax=Thioalkalivibrio paradoxus ARh 1 TaxID=713585 RepID=W0DRS0_9GAMM|nr:DUF2934 domain-containing protein [Thioalkalivibrio paradoxus]AHE99560.1 hypothetical protein THITH_16110 [Thioalkalivibrio paradoxus ARh 1]